jgi:hypothetical protein
MITNFVVAGADEVRAVVESPNPTQQWLGLEADYVDPMKLCALSFILQEQPLEQSALGIYSQQFTIKAARTAKGPWVVSVPSDLVLLLASLPRPAIPTVSEQWFKTDWFQNEPGWHLETVAALLGELARLATEAQGGRKSMFICMST